MSDLNTLVNQYLTPPIHAFWNWSEDGEAIVWADDNRTIAFRKELSTILRRHVSQGLPRLSSLLLVVAACRALIRPKGTTTLTASLSEDFLQLDRIFNIPTELIGTPADKAELTAMLCETDRNRTSKELATAVVDAISGGLGLEWIRPDQPPMPTARQLLDDLKPLLEGLKRFDVESFRLRLATGLEQDIVPAETEEPLAVRIRKLLDSLQHDEEFSGLARLSRNMLSLVNLPRPLSLPDEIPVGGVSDIANRGTLDRLLLSELAQDDEVLMTRLALNEALYFRRETPPQNPPRTRLVVLDTGLRLWGVPRVMATAVGLSFAAMNGPCDLKLLRREGMHLFPADLSTREKLVEHLQILDPHMHPGAALGDLRNWLPTGKEETDVILITSEDVLTDREFQEWLNEFGEPIEFIATVSRTGRYQLLQRTLHGVRLLKEAQLDLEQLLASTPKLKLSLIDKSVPQDFPEILRVAEFPLRLSYNLNPKQTWSVFNHGVLSITNDRRLLHWEDTKHGGRQMTDRLPSRRLMWCQPQAQNGRARFVVGQPCRSQLHLGIVDFEDRGYYLLPLETTPLHAFCVCSHAGVLFVVHRHEVDVCSLATGERMQTMKIPRGYQWSHGRFFRDGHCWKALTYDGVSARFELLNIDLGFGRPLIHFDVLGSEGVAAICMISHKQVGVSIGDSYYPLPELEPPINVLGLSPDGRYVIVKQKGNRAQPYRTVRIDVLSRTVQPAYTYPYNFYDPAICRLVQQRPYLRRFRSIGVYASGLLLTSKSNRKWWLHYDHNSGQYRLEPVDGLLASTPYLKWFESTTAPKNVGYKLQVAQWQDGSRAYLDSRGLLHLKSSDPSVPQTTFVLSDGAVTCWSADGRVWGDPYFAHELDTAGTGEAKYLPSIFLQEFTFRLR